jgi:hypothetical protein
MIFMEAGMNVVTSEATHLPDFTISYIIINNNVADARTNRVREKPATINFGCWQYSFQNMQSLLMIITWWPSENFL